MTHWKRPWRRVRGVSLESDIAQLAIYPEKTIIPKVKCAPAFTATLLIAAETRHKKMPIDRLKFKENVVHVYNRLFLRHEKPPLKLCHQSLQEQTLEDHTLSEVS